MVNPGDAGTRFWLTWYFAVSGGDGVRLANKTAKKAPSTLAELKKKAAIKASGLAGIKQGIDVHLIVLGSLWY